MLLPENLEGGLTWAEWLWHVSGKRERVCSSLTSMWREWMCKLNACIPTNAFPSTLIDKPNSTRARWGPLSNWDIRCGSA